MKSIFTLFSLFIIVFGYSQNTSIKAKASKKASVHRKTVSVHDSVAVNGTRSAKDSLPRQTITEKRLGVTTTNSETNNTSARHDTAFVAGIHVSADASKTFDTSISVESLRNINNANSSNVNIANTSNVARESKATDSSTIAGNAAVNATDRQGFTGNSSTGRAGANSNVVGGNNGNVNDPAGIGTNNSTQHAITANSGVANNTTNTNVNASNVGSSSGAIRNGTAGNTTPGSANTNSGGFNNNNAIVNDSTLNVNTGHTSNTNTANTARNVANGNIANGTVAIATDTIYNFNTVQHGSIPTNSGATDKSGQAQFGQTNWGNNRSTIGESQWTVPPPIFASFNREFPGNGTATWSRTNWTLSRPDSATYTARYKAGSSWITANYNSAGERIDIRTEIPYPKAPQAIKSLIARQFEGFDITSLIRIQVEGKPDTYEIKTRSGRTISITNDTNR